MKNKNQKGFGFVEVIVFGTILSIIVMIYMSWSKILKRSINHMDQKINLETSDMIIEKYLDCCRTYKNYFGEAVYPGNVPLEDSEFDHGPIPLYDSGDNQLLEFVKPWFIVGLPGGSALEINYSETRPNKDYQSRDVSSVQSREKFSGRDRKLKCSYFTNYCGGSTSSSVSTSVSTSTSTGTSSSSSSSGSSGSGGTGSPSTSSSSSSSSSSSNSSGSSGSSPSSSSNSSSSSSGSSNSSSDSSSSSGGTASSSSTGEPSSSSSSSGGGACNFSGALCSCPLPSIADACSVGPCQGSLQKKPQGVQWSQGLIWTKKLHAGPCQFCEGLCQQALDNATNPSSLPNCGMAGCNVGGNADCNCQGVNQALCQASKWLAAAQTCHSDVTVVNCWMRCIESLQQQVIACANCCAGAVGQHKCRLCSCSFFLIRWT